MVDHPPGFRFFPTEEELVGFYLHKKLQGLVGSAIDSVIPVIDINGVEPWNLPTHAGERCRGDTEQWFFFCPGQEREARGGRPSRSTACGYWKATGSPGYVYSSHNRVIGMKKSMVFYKGKAPLGTKTEWKMNEYRAIEFSNQSTPRLRREFSLCRVYVISGSFRAFDRRPLEREGPESQRIVAQQTAREDGSTSSQNSHLGGVYSVQVAESGDLVWNLNVNTEVQLQQPLWEFEWEQFNSL